jgi:outer membrane scaffolding protein for murein synthesis (MipA/OmpV family)
MNPVAGGWTSHKMRSDDYEGKKRAAVAQSGANSYIQGIQSVMDDGAGVAVSNTRTKYGNANVMPQEVLQGQTSNFQQKDSPGNRPMEDYLNQTGSVDTEVSSTNVPQQDPEVMETDALDRRLSMMAKGGQGFPGLNNRNREV